ncbi:MAG: hypothetical protein JWN45_157 [Acidobacteriaceae bacterium]|nr:hypothetical protein [Acidobacteriaceae bacterium]
MNRRMLCTLVAVLSLFAASALADSQVRIVRLSYVDGDVQMDRGDGQGFHRAFLNMPVIQGSRLWTRNDGRAEIEFEDGSTTRLTPETILEFSSLSMRGEDRVTQMNLQEGEAYFNVSKKHDDVTITVKQQYLTPQKSSHFRVVADNQELNLAVFKGDVELVKRSGERVQVRKNETLTLNFNDPERNYLAKGITEESQDLWDRERDQEISTYANRHSFNGYSSAYSYGVSDLNQYGNFVYAGNYGSVWQPYGVGYGWSPFQDGSWVSYPGQGFVWVSSYPWGWTPYRYGSWINVPGRGWCWRPGRNWSNWAAVPVVVNPPTTFVRPVPPATPGVGIVHVGNGGNVIDLGRRRRERDAGTASVPAATTSGTAGSSNLTTGRGTTTITNDNIDRMGRWRASRIPDSNTSPVVPAPNHPVTVSSPAVTPATAPVVRAPAVIVPRTERPSRVESNFHNDRPTGSYDRPARTSPPPSAPASAPMSRPASAPTVVSAPPPAAAPSGSNGGGHDSRPSRTPR